MVKVLNREQGNRMWGGKSNVYGVSGGGTGGGDVDLSSYATMAWTKQNFVSIEYFRTLFKAFDSNDNEIVPNNTTSVVNNIKAMVGLWTEQYLTALGNQSGGGGGGGGAQYLNDLLDVQLTTPLTDGQALVYNATLQKWVNGAAGVNMTTVWNALAGSTNEQINASHLSTALSGYVTTSAISDMATQTWVGQQGFATQTWVTSNFITIAYFDRLFRAYNGSTLVSHNDTTSTIDNIKAMFGFWTDFYLSALGTGGMSSVSISLSQLADVNVAGVTNGQVLSYNSTDAEWVPTTISNVTSLSALTDVALSSPTTYQVLMYDAATTKWYNSALKTINGQPLYGSGDISVGGGASGNYLPLAGGTLTGSLTISAPDYGSRQLIFKNGESLDGYGNFQFTSVSGSIWGVLNYNRTRSILSVSQDDSNVTINSNNDRYLKLYGTTAEWYLIGFKDIEQYFGWNNQYNRFYFSHGVIVNGNFTLNGYVTNDLVINAFDLGNDHGIYLRVLENAPYNCSIFVYDHNSGGANADGISINAYDGISFCTGSNTRQERMRVSQNGNLGIGTTSPSYKLDVSGDIRINSSDDRYIKLYGSTSVWCLIGFDTIDHYFGWRKDLSQFHFSNNINIDGNVYATGAVTALSDIRHKTVIKDAAVSVEDIARMPAVMYQWNDGRDDKELHVGSIAQDWQTVLPEVVLRANDKEGTLSMQYGVAALVSSIIIARKVVNHEERIKQLEKENKKLKERLNIA